MRVWPPKLINFKLANYDEGFNTKIGNYNILSTTIL